MATALGILVLALNIITPYNTPTKLSDFKAPYVCPKYNAPASCTIPIKAIVKCDDMHTDKGLIIIKPLTEIETSNNEKVCKLLPKWLDQDPRIDVVEDSEAKIEITYKMFPSGYGFTGVRIFVNNTNFVVKKETEPHFDKASFFIEKSLIELGKRGYLP